VAYVRGEANRTKGNDIPNPGHGGRTSGLEDTGHHSRPGNLPFRGATDGVMDPVVFVQHPCWFQWPRAAQEVSSHHRVKFLDEPPHKPHLESAEQVNKSHEK